MSIDERSLPDYLQMKAMIKYRFYDEQLEPITTVSDAIFFIWHYLTLIFLWICTVSLDLSVIS